MPYKILLVDDEADILEFMSYNLIKEGYQVQCASNGRQGVELAREFKPHLILLDVMMPELDGFEACRMIRAERELDNTLILFLTARSEDTSQIEGFESGADDYVTKPIRVNVLISRIKAMLKRQEGATPLTGIVIDREKFRVTIDGKTIILPRKEFQLLELLCSMPDRVFTREEIFAQVWGSDVVVGDRTIDVHIRKLREKIGDQVITTVKGVGYKLVVKES